MNKLLKRNDLNQEPELGGHKGETLSICIIEIANIRVGETGGRQENDVDCINMSVIAGLPLIPKALVDRLVLFDFRSSYTLSHIQKPFDIFAKGLESNDMRGSSELY